MTSKLSKFLKSPGYSNARELLLTSRIKYDMLLAAAVRGEDLLIYTPTVDCDGFDLIFDDRRTRVPIQLKSVAGKTNSWEIHRKLIRPPFSNLEGFRLHSPSYGAGRGGGILLVDIKEEHHGESLEISYFYSDFLIIHLFLENLIQPKKIPPFKIDALKYEIIDQMDGKFNLPKWAFVKAKSPEHLLALAGLGSRVGGLWREYMYELLSGKNIPNYQSAFGSEYEMREYIKEHVTKLIGN
ncbi:hypothetical protein [Methylobacter tundripaludum]|uniref:Uncharacterized protein n=1 Tax=Methylobacter tundripaludum (strain ATCC BAA-1195 / DSM 17260 / SV96) TaxID=697282 RepID=G3IXE9_METTV|nr:hypothetical protein [Methylobacter tundripaludum]EGW23206.1 hypothetical protein Mettu_2050 [Methylobacter tundripaludum SV96]